MWRYLTLAYSQQQWFQLLFFSYSKGHSVILFESSRIKAERLSTILRLHKLHEKMKIYLNGFGKIDEVVRNVSVDFIRQQLFSSVNFRISANGLEEQILEGGKNLFSDPLRTKIVLVKYFPDLVRAVGGEPTNIIITLLGWNYRVQLFSSRFVIVTIYCQLSIQNFIA